MGDGWHDAAKRRRIASQLVGDQPPRHAALTLQQLEEEPFGGFPITVRLDENIDHVTILINGAPEILAFALDRDEDLVQVPRITEATLPTLQATGVLRTKLEAPKPDRLVRNCYAAVRQQILNVPEAHTESMIQPYGVADDFCWKSISAVAGRLVVHSPILSVTRSI